MFEDDGVRRHQHLAEAPGAARQKGEGGGSQWRQEEGKRGMMGEEKILKQKKYTSTHEVKRSRFSAPVSEGWRFSCRGNPQASGTCR